VNAVGIELRSAPPVGRWLIPAHGGIAATSQTFTVGRVYLLQFEVTAGCLLDGLSYVVGAASAGNVIGGVIGPVTRTADTPAAGVVFAQSASTGQGTANAAQMLTWTATYARPGIYYAALEGSDVTGTYMRLGNQVQAAGLGATYDRGGGFGALTDPTPAITETGSALLGLRVRIG